MLVHVLSPLREGAIPTPAWRAFEEMDALGSADAADGINAPAMHEGAEIKMPWVFEIAHGVQPQSLDRNAVTWEEHDVGGMDFQADAAYNCVPAVGVVPLEAL